MSSLRRSLAIQYLQFILQREVTITSQEGFKITLSEVAEAKLFALRLINCTTTFSTWLIDSAGRIWLVCCTSAFSCWLFDCATAPSSGLICRARTLGLVCCTSTYPIRLVDCTATF